jgi:hypothetical protein
MQVVLAVLSLRLVESGVVTQSAPPEVLHVGELARQNRTRLKSTGDANVNSRGRQKIKTQAKAKATCRVMGRRVAWLPKRRRLREPA